MSQKNTLPWLRPWLKAIAADLAPLWILITLSVCVGFAANQLRDPQIPLIYASKAERLQQTVDSILSRENSQSAQASAQAKTPLTQPAEAASQPNTPQTTAAVTPVPALTASPADNTALTVPADSASPETAAIPAVSSAEKTTPGETIQQPEEQENQTSQEPQFADLQTVRDIVEGKKPGLIVDARPEIFHRLGHIPGALSLPREDFDAAWKQHRERIEKNKPHPLVVYCSGASCEDSLMVAAALQKLGLPNIRVFKGGWSEWTGAKLPEETAP